jgi:hypothetical protein
MELAILVTGDNLLAQAEVNFKVFFDIKAGFAAALSDKWR